MTIIPSILFAVCIGLLVSLHKKMKRLEIERAVMAQYSENLFKLVDNYGQMICNLINTYGTFDRAGLQYCLICMRIYLTAIQDKAINREDYEEAEEIRKAIEQMDVLINYKGETPIKINEDD